MLLKDRHELDTNMSLFGMLQQTRTWSLDLCLELPDELINLGTLRTKYVQQSPVCKICVITFS